MNNIYIVIIEDIDGGKRALTVEAFETEEDAERFLHHNHFEAKLEYDKYENSIEHLDKRSYLFHRFGHFTVKRNSGNIYKRLLRKPEKTVTISREEGCVVCGIYIPEGSHICNECKKSI